MHCLAISLLSILAGTLLLAKFRKEAAGKFFAFISWFFIVVGFVLFIGCICGGACKMIHHCKGDQPKCGHEMMMKGCAPGMHEGFGCPMEKGMCAPKPGCMPHDTVMKCCQKHEEGVPAKAPEQKK